MANTYLADADGNITGQFTIPPGVLAGTKLVAFTGQISRAEATFVGRGTLKIEDLRVVNTLINRRTLTWNGDPLAQTFILARRQQITAIDLWFTDFGTSAGFTKVVVQVRDVNLGFPTLDVLTEALLTPAEITAQMTANDGFVRFNLPPVMLDADRMYCFVVMCDDAQHTLAIATIGMVDDRTGRAVMEQPYQIGDLLSSSNNRTWVVHPKSDLAFRLLAQTISIADLSKTVLLTPAPLIVTRADHLMIQAMVDRPTPACDVVFTVTATMNNVDATYLLYENQPMTFPATFTGTLVIQATLTGSATASPTLYRNITVVAGERLSPCDYITRAIETRVVGAVDSQVKVSLYYDALLPDYAQWQNNVAVFYQTSESGGVPTWASLPLFDTLNPNPQPLADNWQEFHHEITGVTAATTRIKLTLTGTAQARPILRNLRVAIT